MSRVDEDREAARVAARQAEARRNEELQRNKRIAEGNAFSKLVQGQKKEAQLAREGSLARTAIAQLVEASEAEVTEEARHLEEAAQGAQQEGGLKSKLSAKGQEQKVQQNARSEGQQAEQVRERGEQELSLSDHSNRAEQAGTAMKAQAWAGEAKIGRERLEDRKEASDSGAGSGRNPGDQASTKGEKGLKADSEKGGSKQQGGGQDGKDGSAANPGFRFNPALMAPVPVAKTKETSGSERLRKVAQELAQKIVERVRIGTNAAGKVEFQIDLRSDVLAGLSVKVSAHQGKIRAVFQGSDKDVLKMIEEQEEALRSALGLRGLTLEDLKIEARR